MLLLCQDETLLYLSFGLSSAERKCTSLFTLSCTITHKLILTLFAALTERVFCFCTALPAPPTRCVRLLTSWLPAASRCRHRCWLDMEQSLKTSRKPIGTIGITRRKKLLKNCRNNVIGFLFVACLWGACSHSNWPPTTRNRSLLLLL